MTPSTDAYYTELATRKETSAPEPRTPVSATVNDLDTVYTYWFGCEGRAEHLDPARIRFWMEQSDETDAEVRQRFAHLLPVAARMKWDLERLTPRQAVGLLILVDQVPRNLFRTTGEAFAHDELAREVATRLSRNWHAHTLAERFIVGLPFVHHEDEASQDIAVMIAAREAVEATDEEDRKMMRKTLDQAIRHRDVIRRFGRFPHRNAMLGRISSPAEAAFMAEHGRGF